MCFHTPIASSTKGTSKLAHLSLPSIPVIMADWMNQMANAVDEAEEAIARAQDEVPTEPAITPRSQVQDAPGSPAYGLKNYRLPSLEYGPHPEPERWVTRLDSFLMMTLCAPEEWEEHWHANSRTEHSTTRDMERERRTSRSCRT